MRKVLLSVLVCITLSIATISLAASISPDAAKILTLFAQTMQKIKKEYVHEKSYTELVEAALSGVLSSLDPHSGYLTRKEFEEMKVHTQGEFGGIGVEIIAEKGGLRIISPIDDTPAYHAGIKAGDLIVGVDGTSIIDLKPNEAISKIRGKKGTEVKITISRENHKDDLNFTLKRDIVTVNPIKSHLYNEVAYIRISSFTNQTTAELKKVITNFHEDKKRALAGYIIDLRNNPGGLLSEAIEVTELLLNKKGAIVVSTKGRNSKDNSVYKAQKDGSVKNLPIIVLINSGSASGSEIVAGALQDHKRAILMGTKSFGKGSVQTITGINELGAIKLTTALYYTPSGRSIQAEGIVPDIEVKPAKIESINIDEKNRLAESKLSGHIKNEHSKKKDKNKELWKVIAEKKSTQWEDMQAHDYQLSRALDLLNAMKIYGKANANISR